MDSDKSASSVPRLVAVAGAREGEIFELAGEPLTIGRQSSNRLKLQHASVSRRHCMIEEKDGEAWLRDLESLRGTFVNGAAVGRRRLAHGDFIKVGEALFLYLSEPDAGELAALPAGGGSAAGECAEIEVKSTVEMSLDDAAGLRLERAAGLRPERAAGLRPERAERHLAALLAAVGELHAVRGVEALGRRLGELVFELLPAERAAVLLAEGDEFEIVHAMRRQGGPWEPRLSRTLVRRAVRERVAVLSHDVTGDPALASLESLDSESLSSLLCVPLLAPESPPGVIWAETTSSGKRFEREDLELLGAVAGLASWALASARRQEFLEAENRRIRDAQLEHEILGESPVMECVFKLVARVAPTDLTVLVLGESGTGKELIAQALHRNSPRAGQPFVAVNCATLSETLLESELFGHEKGSFTGAVGRKIGQFELAHEGTIFLDEVGEIPLALQARLLRALEAREIQRVGGARPIAIDVRVIAATNRDLVAEVRSRTFREDLYHRLNVFSLVVPPLCERRGDVPLLANHFVARSARRLNRPVSGLSSQARAAIVAHAWPGNVRELRNAIERAVVLASEELLRLEDLPEAVIESASGAGETADGYHEAVAEAKRRILRQAMLEVEGRYGAAAERLGLNRTYLHRLITQLGLRPEVESLESDG